jgi:hypothetical protein
MARVKNGLLYIISGIPSNNRPEAASQASSEGVSEFASWLGRSWLVDGTCSSSFSLLGTGWSISIAADAVGQDGGPLAESLLVFLIFLFSFSFWNLPLVWRLPVTSWVPLSALWASRGRAPSPSWSRCVVMFAALGGWMVSAGAAVVDKMFVNF